MRCRKSVESLDWSAVVKFSRTTRFSGLVSVTDFWVRGAESIFRRLIVPQSRNSWHFVTPTDLWLVTDLSQMNPAHSFPCHLRSILILSHQRMRLPSRLFPSCLLTTVVSTCLLQYKPHELQVSIFYFINQTIVDNCKSRSS